MKKIELALEVLRMNTGGDVRTEAYKVVREALNPPTVAENPEAAWKRHQEEELNKLEKEALQEDRYYHLKNEMEGCSSTIDRTRQWLRDVEKLTNGLGAAVGFAYLWLIVLTILFIVNM